MRRRTVGIKAWAGTGITLGVLFVLYIAGLAAGRENGLEYQSWVTTLAGILFFQGIPFWIFCTALWGMRRAKLRKLIVVPAGILLGGLYLWWFFLSGFGILFTMQTEKPLQGEGYDRRYLLTDVKNVWLEPASWGIYESVWGVFRRPCEREAVERQYLEKKYGEPFERRALTESMREYFGNPARNDREEGWFSQSHPDVPVYVEIRYPGLYDDYLQRVADRIFYETWKTRGLGTGFLWKDGRFTLLLKEDELESFCREAQILLETAMEDNTLQKQRFALSYEVAAEESGSYYYGGFLPAGQLSEGEPSAEGYCPDLDEIRKRAKSKIEDVRKDRAGGGVQTTDRTSAGDGKEQAIDRDPAGDGVATDSGQLSDQIQAAEAEEIFRQEIAPAGIGSGFTVCFNAKGFPYYYLGEDGAYAYTIVYDRKSKNGKCRLYVFYKSPRDASGDGYAGYTDTGTVIENIYAYVTDTGEIVPSGKKSWGDAGTAEYRSVTGE